MSDSNMDLIRSVWEEARDLVQRLEGSTVRRFSVQAGETKIEIERTASGVAIAPAAVQAEPQRRPRPRASPSWTAAIRSSRRSSARSTGLPRPARSRSSRRAMWWTRARRLRSSRR